MGVYLYTGSLRIHVYELAVVSNGLFFLVQFRHSSENVVIMCLCEGVMVKGDE